MVGGHKDATLEMEEAKPDLTQETAERLLFLIRLSHPDEHGEPYSRAEVIEEITRRRFGLLKALGWGIDLEGIYKNRYTASEETLKSLLQSHNQCSIAECSQLFSTIENWTPKHLWTSDAIFDKYNPKGTIGGWI